MPTFEIRITCSTEIAFRKDFATKNEAESWAADASLSDAEQEVANSVAEGRSAYLNVDVWDTEVEEV